MKLCPDIIGFFWVFSKTKFSLAHLISINILFPLNGTMYFKGTWFYPMFSNSHSTNYKDVRGYYKKNFVGFCRNILTGHWLPEVGNYDGECLLTTSATPASLLYDLHKKRDVSWLVFVTGTQTLPDVGSLNLCEILEPHFPHKDTHSSGRVAVASADGDSVNHRDPHSELRMNFPQAASLKCCSSTGHKWADILCSSCFASRQRRKIFDPDWYCI